MLIAWREKSQLSGIVCQASEQVIWTGPSAAREGDGTLSSVMRRINRRPNSVIVERKRERVRSQCDDYCDSSEPSASAA